MTNPTDAQDAVQVTDATTRACWLMAGIDGLSDGHIIGDRNDVRAVIIKELADAMIAATLAERARMTSDAAVGRVARALAVANGKNPDQKSHNSFEWWRHYVPQARAALNTAADGGEG